MAGGDNGVDASQLKGLSKYFNSQTNAGRANVRINSLFICISLYLVNILLGLQLFFLIMIVEKLFLKVCLKL